MTVPRALIGGLVRQIEVGLLLETEAGIVIVANPAFCRLVGLPDPPETLVGKRGADLRHRLTARDLDWRCQRIVLDTDQAYYLWHISNVIDTKTTTAEHAVSQNRLRQLSTYAEDVREQERKALANALHDNLGQVLTNIRLELTAAIAAYREQPVPGMHHVVDRLQSIAGLLDLGATTLRDVTRMLRPPVLDHLGLLAAVEWEARMFSDRTGLRCAVKASPKTLALHGREATVLYRILLEALNNVAKHSHASRVWILVRRKGDVVYMHVRDNGRGITPNDVSEGTTMGLLAMRERALAVGGDVLITSRPGAGTRVLVILPTPGGAHAPRADR